MKKLFFTLITASIIIPQIVSATVLTNPLGTTDIRVLAGNIIKAVLGLSGAAAFLMFVWGGTQWIISGGKKESVEKGKQTLLWATFGLLFIFVAYALLTTLLQIIGSASS